MLVHDIQGIDEVELFSGAPHLQSLLSTLADYLIPPGVLWRCKALPPTILHIEESKPHMGQLAITSCISAEEGFFCFSQFATILCRTQECVTHQIRLD